MNIVLSRLKEIASAVLYAAEAPDLETVLERIATVARELAETRYAALGIPDGKGGLRFFKTSGMPGEEMMKIPHLPQGHGLIGAIMREKEAIRLEHIEDDERSSGFPENHPPMDAFLGVPIRMGQQLYGMLYLTDKIDGTVFNDQDQLLIETLAGYAGLAIASAEVNQQNNRMRLLEERERIGMQLHDGIIQSLYGIGMQVELLRLEDEVKGYQLLPVTQSLNDVIEDIRRYILDLRQGNTSQATIRECMLAIPKRLHAPETINFIVDAPSAMPPFTPAVFESVCLIVMEAVSNAIRHAQPSTITLKALKSDGEGNFFIQVTDDGVGFIVADTEKHSGLGLRNMQKRARLYGGEIIIDSALRQGTRLAIKIPLRSY